MDIDVSPGVDDPKSEQQEPDFAAARREIERFGAENAELKMLIAEQQKALDAAAADIARLRLTGHRHVCLNSRPMHWTATAARLHAFATRDGQPVVVVGV